MEGVAKMKKVFEGIYVGTVDDIPFADKRKFSVLGACKEPLHRQHARPRGAEQDGYLGRALPKDEPEYLYAEREHALYCNLIDADDPKYISDIIVDKCMSFVDSEFEQGRNVLIVCNKAESRSPSIALMWLIRRGLFDYFAYKPHLNFEDVLLEYSRRYYFNYKPSNGFKQYVKEFWEEYKNGKQQKAQDIQ